MDVKAAKQKLFNPTNNTYFAGSPIYERNFSRDSIIYALLSGDTQALLAQVDYSASQQGVKYNQDNGEEPGKIHHEYPSGTFRGRPTAYNACDTNALFLIAISCLVKQANLSELPEKYSKQINSAISYIKNHVKDGLFYEDPSLCGADSFAVRVTYWKDSILNSDREEPLYPTVYSLVHFMSAFALQQIGKVLGSQELLDFGDRMTATGIEKLWRGDHFVAAIDASKDIDAPSSDSLHALLYIDSDQISSKHVEKIIKYSAQLETKAGFRSGIAEDISDTYHTQFVWVFEQALLHAAATKHGQEQAAQIPKRVLDYMGDEFPELIDIEDNFAPAGNKPQLWSVGAYEYFENPELAFLPI